MKTTSRFDDQRTVEFFGGPWCGMRYTPSVGEQLPALLHVRWSEWLCRYELRKIGDGFRFDHVGSALPDGASMS